MNTLLVIALAVVVLILLAGLVTLFRPGPSARNLSNKLMRYRVLAQFVAILIILAILYFGGR
jgi:hypothetical protein